LEILWLVYHNSEIDWKTGKVKIKRCPEECGKQQRPKQGKLRWQKQKEERKDNGDQEDSRTEKDLRQ